MNFGSDAVAILAAMLLPDRSNVKERAQAILMEIFTDEGNGTEIVL